MCVNIQAVGKDRILSFAAMVDIEVVIAVYGCLLFGLIGMVIKLYKQGADVQVRSDCCSNKNGHS